MAEYTRRGQYGEGFDPGEERLRGHEFIYPYYRFQEARYEVAVVGPQAYATYISEYGIQAKLDMPPDDVKIEMRAL